MLRWILRTPLYLARQARRTRPSLPAEDPQEESEVQANQASRSQYHQTKQKYYSLDELANQTESKGENYQFTMQFIKKMMKQTENGEEGKPAKKQKVDIEAKLKKMGTPESLLKSSSIQTITQQKIQANERSLSQHKLHQLSKEKAYQQTLIAKINESKQISPEQYEKMKEIELLMARQDLALNQIMKNASEKELSHINRVQDKPDEFGYTEKDKKMILRQEKIIEALQNKEDPSQKKYEINRGDLLRMKYSPEIIEKAKEYYTHELAYFKELIVDQNLETSLERNILHRRKFLKQEDEAKWLRHLEDTKSSVPSKPQNTYKTSKTEQGLVQYEDTEFYQKKALKEIKEKQQLTEQDKLIMRQFQKDLGFGNKSSDVFLDEVAFPAQAKLQRKIAMNDTSFGKQKKQIQNLSTRLQKLGLSYSQAEIHSLSKNSLFQQKKFLEEQQRFQKYLHQKQKKKNMKKQLKQIHETTLKDDLDFNKAEQSVMSIKEIKDANSLEQLQDNYQKMNEYYEQKQSTIVQETPEEKKSRIHHMKTFTNMHSVVTKYFAQGVFHQGQGQLNQIEIRQIVPNKTNTVLNIFWDIQPNYLQERNILPGMDNYEKEFERIKKTFEEKLKKQASYLSGKMTQALRLRYGPEIRFIYDKKTKETLEAIQELKKYVNQIAMVEVEEYTKKGLIKSEKQSEELFKKMQLVAENKLGQFNSRKELLSKKYKKKQKLSDQLISSQFKAKQTPKTDQKKPRNHKRINPIFQKEEDDEIKDEVPKKKSKKHPIQKFWDTVDLL